MARKDNKGRNLKTGEYQRPDGRYEYRYKDEITGKRNSVYAADLASLREMEKKINKDMDDLLITDSSVKKLTVNTLFERYMATKNIKERTKKNYIRMWDYPQESGNWNTWRLWGSGKGERSIDTGTAGKTSEVCGTE